MPLRYPTETDLPFVSRLLEGETTYRSSRVDNESFILIYCNQENVPVGVVFLAELDAFRKNAALILRIDPGSELSARIRMALEAMEVVFGKLCLHKVSCEITVDDKWSAYLYKKIGFVEEGRLREHQFDGSRYVDVLRLGLFATEWYGVERQLKDYIFGLEVLAEQKDQKKSYSIVVLSDSSSWINFDIQDLCLEWTALGHQVHWAHKTENIPSADFCFCLSFGRIVSSAVRSKFRHTLVVHESELPRGKGWSPLTWQIIEGVNRIPVTLLEAVDQVDSGTVYAQCWIEFQGDELVDDLRKAQAKTTHALCRWFVDEYPNSAMQGREQRGEESFYPRRRAADSELDPNKTISEQFNLLRVVDNLNYPAFFRHSGGCYRISIERMESDCK